MYKLYTHTSPFAKALCIAALLLCFVPGFAQQNRTNDSLMDRAKMLTYSNPEQAAKDGLTVFNNAKGNDSLQIQALLIVANAHFAQRNSFEGKQYATQALQLAEGSKDYASEVKVYGLLGNHYQIIRMNEKARFYLNKAEEIINRHPLPQQLSYIKGNIFAIKGNSYKEELDCDFAIEYFDKAIHEFKNTSHVSGLINLRLVQIQKGFCLLQKDMMPEAEAIFTEALGTMPQDMAGAARDARTGLAKAYYAKRQFKEAVAILQEALRQLEQSGSKEDRGDIYQNLSASYARLNDFDNYTRYNTLFHQSDLASEQKSGGQFNLLVNELSADAETRLDNSQKSYSLYIILIGGAGTVLLFLLGVRIIRRRKQVSALTRIIFRNTLQG